MSHQSHTFSTTAEPPYSDWPSNHRRSVPRACRGSVGDLAGGPAATTREEPCSLRLVPDQLDKIRPQAKSTHPRVIPDLRIAGLDVPLRNFPILDDFVDAALRLLRRL